MADTPSDIVATGLRFPEGPIAMADGSVVLVEIAGGTLTRVRPDGTTEVIAEHGGGPNGAAVGPDGAVYIANNGGYFEWSDFGGLTVPGSEPPASWEGGCLQRVDLATGSVETAGHRRAATPGCRPPTTSCSMPTAASGSPTTA